MLRARFVLLSALLLMAVAGCSADRSPASGESEPPPLSQASPTPAAPVSTRTPGPALTVGCPLLRPAEVAGTLGVATPTATEKKVVPAVVNCRYQIGARWHVELFVATEPATGTAEQAVNRVIKQYTGDLHPVPGIGDAAFYNGGATVQVAASALLGGKQMRVVTLICSLDAPPEAKVVALLRLVTSRV